MTDDAGDESSVDDSDLRAADGRVPGRRGRATRQRLLEQTLSMIGDTSFRDLKVVDIAREAGTSPATFYQYFPDVEAAILALAEDMAIGPTVEPVKQPAAPARTFEISHRFQVQR